MIKIGDVLSNRYRITGRIGTGGTAEVYLATDFIKKETVAVKIIKEELINDPRSVARFEHEAAACASFSHQNIVRVYNQGQVNGCSYLIFEYVKGQTLFDRLDFQATFSVKEASENSEIEKQPEQAAIEAPTTTNDPEEKTETKQE